MNRRLILTSIASFAAAPVLVPSALAQDAPAQLSAARQTHITDTLAVGSLSLMLSRIAEPRVYAPPLKQFAGFEIAEQETIASILGAIRNGGRPSGAVPSPSDSDVMQTLDAAGRAEVEKLRQMAAGRTFDREYLRAQIEGHNKLLDIQEAYLRAPDDLDETNVAKLARGMIKEHLTLLGDIQSISLENAERMRGQSKAH
ncbi:uncharacterized protein DUF4142 [Roseiarcus fermentans]|uniref:Uncharacterized protein DUF4142 n=1 Tax=Roseiarcus fermentans TaxID=1473586 RepID=A0A366ERK3_9HYPH|nr:DUF4142 domain-containing protein [Roseiarcus fermentans]RBP04566.1 uncharacterized protein DUF4142 [Roseiarcus fermentans]